ncbi:MAG: TetR/AcrR family transcriptional repressor of nem operon [Paraglaciecola sp.]|jgi:TetR/AcrR family transcriptional repressor of nem operon
MKQTKSEKTRRFIIEKSAELFNKQGFHGTSMNDIMQATGLTKGGIYGNFKKEGSDKKGVKSEIALAAFAHAVDKVSRKVRERTTVIDNTLDKLKAVVYFYKERILNPPVEGGCPIQNASVEADDNNPIMRDKVLQAIEDWHGSMVYTVNKGIKRGEIRIDANADEFATLFIGTLEGGIMLAQIYKDVKYFDVMAKQLVNMIDNLKPVSI